MFNIYYVIPFKNNVKSIMFQMIVFNLKIDDVGTGSSKRDFRTLTVDNAYLVQANDN